MAAAPWCFAKAKCFKVAKARHRAFYAANLTTNHNLVSCKQWLISRGEEINRMALDLVEGDEKKK